jgi:O-antigen ligase
VKLRLSLERAAAAALALTVAAVAWGSSTTAELAMQPARATRWVALAVLCALAVALAWRRRRALPRALGLPLLGALVVSMALVSSMWSVLPELTARRAASFGLVVITAGALALAAAGRPGTTRLLLASFVVAAAVVAVAGVVLFVVDRESAVQQPLPDAPGRYRGFGISANTMPMLFALAVPAALWFGVRARARVTRLASMSAAALMLASVFASGSRGATLASLAGVLALVLLFGRAIVPRLALAGATIAVFASGAALADMRAIRAEFTLVAPHVPARVFHDAWKLVPLESEVAVGGPGAATAATPLDAPSTATAGPPGIPERAAVAHDARPQLAPSTPRRVTVRLIQHFAFSAYESGRERPPGIYTPPVRGVLGGKRGRLVVWQAALEQVGRRPLTGYGFGVEDYVFVDRSYDFEGSRPENSYLGLLLQLGITGLAAFLAVLAAAVATVTRALRNPLADRDAVAVCASGVVVGAVLAVTQSYVYSAGNVATLGFWMITFLVTACAAESSSIDEEAVEPPVRERRRELVTAAQ